MAVLAMQSGDVAAMTLALVLGLLILGGPVAAGHILRYAGPKEPVPADGVRWRDVDMDILRQIESAGDDHARSPAGARGPYQLTHGAWSDSIRWLAARGRDVSGWDYDTRVEDPVISRVISWVYINEVIPGYLTVELLDWHDTTGPVPDTLYARLAAYNAGALRVRQAWATGGQTGWFMKLPAETRQFILSYRALREERDTEPKD